MKIFDFFKRKKDSTDVNEEAEFEDERIAIEENSEATIDEDTEAETETDEAIRTIHSIDVEISQETKNETVETKLTEEIETTVEEESQTEAKETEIEEKKKGFFGKIIPSLDKEATSATEVESTEEIETTVEESQIEAKETETEEKKKGFFGKIIPSLDKEATSATGVESTEEIEITVEESQTEAVESESEKKKGLLSKIISGLGKTRKNLLSGVENVLKGFTKIDEELFEELEEVLIMADLGVETATSIVQSVKERVKKEKITEVESIKGVLIEEIAKILQEGNTEFLITPPTIMLIIGVNGAGKTTTIGKLSNIYKQQGKKVMLAAGDTFRAAAIDQLEVWANRSNVELIKHQENSDPAAVVFDAVKAAKARKTDILICDTAGRLHNKKNLMEELKKIFKVIGREYPEAQIETLLVLDGTTGQNALQQAKSFKDVCDITGIVLTKLDGTAKGGVVISIKNELQVPVRFIGVGEGIDDLQVFDAENFARALFYEA